MFAKALLAWHGENAREFPWRNAQEPYCVWISEIMLQQTRTGAVKERYQRFVEQFPTVFSLAGAEEETVLKAWEGMGYYSRARNLHKAARIVVEEWDGQLPGSAQELKKLPGIGAYTAAAIASIAFGERELALDGNAVRVFSRVFADTRVMTEPVKRDLTERAAALLPETRSGDFNQAIMGLANLICLPARPDCARCPVASFCQGSACGIAHELPVMPEKAARRVERRTVALVFCGNRILARRRPDEGLLAGMWEFPHFLDVRTEAELLACLAEMDVHARIVSPLPEAKHIFSHITWQMTGWMLEAERADKRFLTLDQLNALPFPSAIRVYTTLAKEELGKR